MSSPSRPLHQRIFVHILPFYLALLPAVNSSADDLPMAQPESVGVSSSRLDRLTKSMQRYIDSDKLAGTVSLICLLYTSPSPRDAHESRMPSSA